MMPYVCVLGFLPALYGFSGYDGSAHMSEETVHASTVRQCDMGIGESPYCAMNLPIVP